MLAAQHGQQALNVTQRVRWRGKLQEGVANCDPVLKVNKELRVLEITSTPGVQIAQQVEEHLGPVKELSTADMEGGAQNRTGSWNVLESWRTELCRPHLQCNANHVRLFGRLML